MTPTPAARPSALVIAAIVEGAQAAHPLRPGRRT